MTKKTKLGLFQLLNELGHNNRHIYSTFTDDEKASFAPLVIQKWLASGGDRETFFLNVLANPYVFSLAKHKELLFRLMSICGSGKRKKYRWKPQKDNTNQLHIEVIKEYFRYSTREARGVIHLLTLDDIVDYAEQLGYSDSRLAKLKKT